MDKTKPLFNLPDEAKKSKIVKDKDPEDQAGELLRPRKTFRDAVHGDIMVTKLELAVMDTEEFQRLGKMKQLGPSHLVYRCATHTRFDHSLGTLHMAQRLIDFIQKNPFPDPKFSITNCHILMTRMCALLHDLVNVPFGHTLEDEGNLFKSQWADKKRVEHFLGIKSTIGKNIIQICDENGLDGKRFLQEIRNILSADEEEDIEKLPYPFISDIVHNTICADLLDYVFRDVYFCGLKESYDERFLSYFYITTYDEKWRLVLRLIKPTTRRLRRDVLSETLHLLRLRYSLAEKVYYHHAKVKASAMIISAVNSALRSGKIAEKDLYEKGDEELLALVGNDIVGSYILNKLKRRELYRPVYRLSYLEQKLGSEVANRRKEIIEKFRNPLLRYEAERTLEDMNFLEKGQVIVYCPGSEMGHKAVKTLVEWENGKGPLNMIPDKRIADEIKTSIEDKHKELWNMFVFIDPIVSEKQRADIASDCVRSIVREMNEMEEYRDIREDYLERYKVCAEKELETTASSHQMAEIRNTAHRYVREKRFFGNIMTYSNFKELLTQ